MPVLKLNALGAVPSAADGAIPLDARLDAALSCTDDRAPIVVLLHGFRFSPYGRNANPHEHILALDPGIEDWKAVSWPRALGFDGTTHGEGLCLAFGWEAAGSIWAAYDEAGRAGLALADVICRIAARAPGRRVDLIGHSLGARVALAALAALPSASVGHAILMAPAEFRARAAEALDSPAGRQARLLNVTSRENDLYDRLLECLLDPTGRHGRTLGQGLSRPEANRIDLQIDDPETLEVLAELGHRIPPPSRRICHWSPYLRPGMLDLYRALIRGALSFERLRSDLPEARSARWSRLISAPRPALPLPFARKAPS